MKKSFYSICFFISSLLIFKQPVTAAEPNTIKLSELEDGQNLEINDLDTVLEIDTDKTLSEISVSNCKLTIKGTGTLALENESDNPGINCKNSGTIIIDSGSIISDLTLKGNCIINDGKIDISGFSSAQDGDCFTMNGGDLHTSTILYDNDNSEVRINDGHIECESFIRSTHTTISDNMFIVHPYNEYFYYDDIVSQKERGINSNPIQIVPKSEIPPVEGISFSKSSYTIGTYETVYPRIIFTHESAIDHNLKVTCSDPSIVFLSHEDDYIEVVGEKYGTATITATTEDGKYTATCEIIVSEETDEQNDLKIKFAQKENEKPRIVGVKYRGKDYSGFTTHYEIGDDKNFTLSIPFFEQPTTVAEPGAAADNTKVLSEVPSGEGIAFTTSSYTIGTSETVHPHIIYSSEDIKDHKLNLTCSDPSVAFVVQEDDCIEIVGTDYGTATITATTEDGKYIATCEVTVSKEIDEQNDLKLIFALDDDEMPYVTGIKYKDQYYRAKYRDYEIDDDNNFTLRLKLFDAFIEKISNQND